MILTVICLVEVNNAFPLIKFDYIDDRWQISGSHIYAIVGVPHITCLGKAEVYERHLNSQI